MWFGLAVAVVVATPQAMKSFGVQHEPELPNSKLKLPFRLLCVAICIALAVSGVEGIVFSILGGLFMTEIGFILAGRNPWWMQAPIDKRECVRHHSASRNLDLSA